MGDADLQRPATFRLLALRLLGMVRRRGSVRLSLRGRFLNAAASHVTAKNQNAIRLSRILDRARQPRFSRHLA